MTTFLHDGNRRCDATCHNAEGEHCDCICEGQNHGSTKPQMKLFRAEPVDTANISTTPVVRLKRRTWMHYLAESIRKYGPAVVSGYIVGEPARMQRRKDRTFTGRIRKLLRSLREAENR